MKNKTNSSIKFKFYYEDNNKEGLFLHIPTDLERLLSTPEGVMMPITDNLHYNQYYTIEINIKSAK